MTAALRELVSAIQGSLLQGDPHLPIGHVTIDSRQVQAGDVFFAVQGLRHDGHDHLREAADQGAVVMVVQQIPESAVFHPERCPAVIQVDSSVRALQKWAAWIRERRSIPIIGITGSNGKTTTKEMLAAILKRVGPVLATRGNLNNHFGVPLMLTELTEEHRFAVIEMGASMEGDIALLAEISQPTIGIITNIGKAHLEGLQSPEGVLKVKRALFDALPSDGVAIVNLDDSWLAPLAETLPCRRVTYGLASPQADVRAEHINTRAAPLRFELHIDGQRRMVRLPLPGSFQVWNALAASAAAYALGISIDDIAEGLERFTPMSMRMQVLNHHSGALLVNDAYNANPSSMRASIEGICRSYPGRNTWLVIGDMRELGVHAAEEHRQLGVWLASQPVERIWLYGRDTRFVLEGLRAAEGPVAERYHQKRMLCQSLKNALNESGSQKTVLLKASRRMKLEQIVNGLMETI